MDVKLVITKGEQEGKIFTVRAGDSKIMGRSSKTDLIVRDVGISRLHCQLANDGEQCRLADMNSKNGTSVNNKRILEDVQLQHGDQIEIGTTVLSVHFEYDLAPAEQAPAPVAPVAAEPAPAAVDAGDEPGPEADPAPPAFDMDAFTPAEPTLAAEPTDGEEPADAVMGSFEQWLSETQGRSESPPTETTPPAEAAATVQAPPAEAKPPESDACVGRTIGGCRIDRLLGHDEMTTIYEAVQLSMERTVLLKILDEEMAADHEAVNRFIWAAREAGRISHPNIVQIYDSGQAGDLYYVALERVGGQSVAELLKAKGKGSLLPLAQALEIVEQIAAALDHVHGQEITHGNVTPAHILVTPHGVAKLAELGFARNQADIAAEEPAEPGDLVYAAPEQLSSAALAGPKADIYSLGAVLFTMLAGRPPFPAASTKVFIEAALKGQSLSLAECNKTLPEAVVAMVSKAMRPPPPQRYATAGELHSALRAAREEAR